MITSLKEINEIASAWQKSSALFAAFELKLFNYVGHGATALEIATSAGSDPRTTDRLLTVLATMGLMAKDGDVYTNSPAAAEFLVEGENGYLSSLEHSANTYRNWGTLGEAVQKGTSVLDLNFDSPDRLEAFIEAMHRRAKYEADDLISHLDLSNVERVLDVGGGSGVYSMAMCKANDRLQSTVLDLPDVTPLTQKYVAEAGLEERIDTQDGSYHDADYGSGYDLVFFSAIVHINSFDENQNLVNKAYTALNPGGAIAIQDFIMEEDRMKPEGGAMFALNMIVNTRAGDSFTRSEITSWLEKAGCGDVQYRKTGPTTAMLIGFKR